MMVVLALEPSSTRFCTEKSQAKQHARLQRVHANARYRLLPGRKLDIRLDRLTDTYGSPSIDDIEKFSR